MVGDRFIVEHEHDTPPRMLAQLLDRLRDRGIGNRLDCELLVGPERELGGHVLHQRFYGFLVQLRWVSTVQHRICTGGHAIHPMSSEGVEPLPIVGTIRFPRRCGCRRSPRPLAIGEGHWSVMRDRGGRGPPKPWCQFLSDAPKRTWPQLIPEASNKRAPLL